MAEKRVVIGGGARKVGTEKRRIFDVPNNPVKSGPIEKPKSFLDRLKGLKDIFISNRGFSDEQLNQVNLQDTNYKDKAIALAKTTGEFANIIPTLGGLLAQGVANTVGTDNFKNEVRQARKDYEKKADEILKPSNPDQARAMKTIDMYSLIFPANRAKDYGKIIDRIAKSTEEDVIRKELKNFSVNGNVAEDIIPKLKNVNDPQAVSLFIRNAEIVSAIEKKTSSITTPEIRAKIGSEVAKIQATDNKTVSAAIKKITNDVIASAPKEGNAYNAQKLSKLAENSFLKNANDATKKSDRLNGEGFSFKEARTGKAENGENLSGRIVFGMDDEGKINLEDGRHLLEAYRREGIPVPKEKVKFLDSESEKAFTKMMKADEKTGLIAKIRRVNEKQAQQLARPVKKSQITSTPKPKKVVTNEKKALKDKLKAESRGARKAASATRKTTQEVERKVAREKVQKVYTEFKDKKRTLKDFRNAVRLYAKDLPLPMQRKLLSKKSFSEISNSKGLTKLLQNVDKSRNAVKKELSRRDVLKEVKSLMKTVREKGLSPNVKARLLKEFGVPRAIIKDGEKTGKFRTVLNRAIIDRLPEDKLTRAKEIILDAMKQDKPTIDYSKVNVGKFKVGTTKKETIGQGVNDFGRNSLSSISTNIEDLGGAKLKYAGVRRFMFNKSRREMNNKKMVEGFFKKIDKLNSKLFKGRKRDYDTMTYALYNRDLATARGIAEKYGFEKEFDKVIAVLKKTRDEQIKVGIKVGDLPDYFPRVVKDYDGLYQAYMKKFGKEGDKYLNTVLTKWAKDHYKNVSQLTQEERADILNKAFRGYGERVNAGVGKPMLSRKFNELTDDLINYYHTPEESLQLYLAKSNERIELQKLIGGTDDIEGSIGRLVEGMSMTPNQKAELVENLKVLLAPKKGESKLSRAIRVTSTVTLLSHSNAAITQISDIGVNAIDHGFFRAVASVFRKKPIKRKELFDVLMAEMSKGKFTDFSLKVVGFDLLDKINVEARMGNDFRKATRALKKGTGKEYRETIKKLRNSFPDADEFYQVVEDFKNKKVTDLTRFHVFNEVLDVSPRAISEMPKTYIENPNLRSLYSMKSYSIKILDIYRNRVLREENKSKAVMNAVKITAYLTAAGMSADQVKNWWYGKEQSISDLAVNNLLKIIMLSQYDGTNIQNDGLGMVILSKVLFPTRIINDISQDIFYLMDEKEGNETFKTIRNLPIVGGEIYNRFGGGKEKIEKENTAIAKEKLDKKQVNKKPVVKKPVQKKPVNKKPIQK